MARFRLIPLTSSFLLMLAPVLAGQAQPGTPAQRQNVAPAGQDLSQLSAPMAAQAEQQVPLFRTNANLVLVDVVVRQKGAPVEGLKASDFEVREDGKLQKITVFEEHRATDAAEAATAPQLPPHVYSDAPQYTVTSAANVLLLDGLNTPLSDQVYVRRRMLAYLATIPPGTRIAVFTLGSKLHIITGFTTNAAEIAKALGPGRGQGERSPALDPALDNTLNLQDSLAQSLGLSGIAVSGIEQFISDTENFEVGLREEMTIDALDQIARYLSIIPGRKNLIWFSGAFPLRFLQGGANPNMDPMADYTGQVKKAAELLALARVAVYPVDSRGLLNNPSSDASTVAGISEAMQSAPAGATTNGQGAVGTGGGGNTGIGSFSADQENSMNSQPGVGGDVTQGDQTFLSDTSWDHFNMEQIATETGGKAYFNRNGLGQIVGEAIANGSSYYTVGYDPANQNYNGAMRKIEVRLEGGRYDLEYRHAYFADSPAEAMKWIPGKMNPLIDAMQHGTLPLSQVIFEVRALPEGDPALGGEKPTLERTVAAPQGLKHPTHYLVDYWVDPREVQASVLPNGKQHREIELTQVAYDDEGIRVNFTDVGLGVDLTDAQAAQAVHGGIRLHQEIDLPAGQLYLRVGVHDLLSGRIGTVEIPVNVGK